MIGFFKDLGITGSCIFMAIIALFIALAYSKYDDHVYLKSKGCVLQKSDFTGHVVTYIFINGVPFPQYHPTYRNEYLCNDGTIEVRE